MHMLLSLNGTNRAGIQIWGAAMINGDEWDFDGDIHDAALDRLLSYKNPSWKYLGDQLSNESNFCVNAGPPKGPQRNYYFGGKNGLTDMLDFLRSIRT
jgi:hypothetical protein